MSEREDLLKSIATTIADYRAGEVPARTPEHVDTWVKQFSEDMQLAILAETDHVLKQVYFSKMRCAKFLSSLAVSDELTKGHPKEFWKGVGLLSIQKGGNSQKDFLKLFDVVLKEKLNLGVQDCEPASNEFVYLDDVIASGNRVIQDLTAWIKGEAPKEAQVHIVAIAVHTNGEHYANTKLAQVAGAAGKKISLKWWRSLTIEDQKIHTDQSEVLRPTAIPDDPNVKAYVKELTDAGYPPVLRSAGKKGSPSKVFGSETGRQVLEQEFLKAGAEIRKHNPHLKTNHRPLGYSVLRMLGFGSMIVTFRNCPNNCPLALWVDDPWSPLFPRKNN